MPRQFWAFEGGDISGTPTTLRLEGPIAEESWWGDEVTPAQFRADLEAHPGDLTVYINSPGGDVVAGSLIYSMLKEHPGNITVRIDGIAASAASVVAMAGDRVEMAPTAYMMIHNAATVAMGDNREMRRAADMLDEINRGIRTAYAIKTGKSERELAKMMDAETWMSAAKALEDGFCDAISYGDYMPGEAADRADIAAAVAKVAETVPLSYDAVANAASSAASASGCTTSASGCTPYMADCSAGMRYACETAGLSVLDGIRAGLRATTLPAVAYSARAMSESLLDAAKIKAASKEQKKTNEAEAARARLRLLIM